MSGFDGLPEITAATADQMRAASDRYREQQATLKERAFQQAVQIASKVNPNLRAEQETIATKLGVPPESIGDNIEVAREMLRAREMMDVKAQDAPNLVARMADVKTAPMVHDDIGNLVAFESTLDWMGRRLRGGDLVNEYGMIGTRMGAVLRDGDENPDDVARARQLEELMAENDREDSWVGEALGLIGQMGKPLLKAAGASFVTGRTVGMFNPLAGAATASFTFSSSMFAQSAITEGGAQYLALRQQGYDRTTAQTGAAFAGMLNGALEMVGVGFIANPVKKMLARRAALKLGQAFLRPTMGAALKEAGKEYLTQLVGEPTTEGVQEFVNILIEESARVATGSDRPAVTRQEAFDRIAGVMVKTAKGMTLVGLASPSIRMIGDASAVREAGATMSFLRSLRKTSVDSKVRKRSPNVFLEHLRDSTKGTPVENLYIEGVAFQETLNQLENAQNSDTSENVAGPSVSEQLDALMGEGTAKRVSDAAAAQADVVLPLADVETKLAGTAIGDALLQHSRVTKNSLSFAEAKVVEKMNSEEFRASAQKTLDEAQKNNREFFDSAKRVEETVHQQIVAAMPKFTAEEARKSATLYRDFAVVQAAELKITPEEFYQRYPYKIVRGEPVEQAAADTLDTLPREPFVANEGPANEDALKMLLKPPGEVPQIGAETVQHLNDNLIRMSSAEGSVRYVATDEDNKPVAVLQLVRQPGSDVATVANVYTTPEARRQGYARTLFEHAREDFAEVQHSKNLTPLGAAFANAVSSTSLPGSLEQALEQLGETKIKDPTPAMVRAIKHLTPDEQRMLTDQLAKTMLTHLRRMPSAREMAAVALGGAAKRGWYRESARALVAVFGVDAPRFAMLLAAMSPQTSVPQNLENALNTWKNWVEAGRPTDREAVLAVMGRSVQGTKGVDSVLDAWVNNAVRALADPNPTVDSVLSGPKVLSFYLNLIGVTEEVTNDAWVASYALVDQGIFGGRKPPVDHPLAGTGIGIKGPGYLAMNARVREAAAYLTEVSGETWTPAEVQETIGSWAKALYELQTSDVGAVQLLQEGKLTDALIDETPDFASLFHDPKYAKVLTEAGYATELSKLRSARAAAAEATAGQPRPRVEAEAFSLEDQSKLKLDAARRLERRFKQRAKEARAKERLKRRESKPLQQLGDSAAGTRGGVAAGEPAVYGTPIDGASSVVGVHFSQQPRTNLSTAAYGSGLAGAERARVAGDPVLGARSYFYVDIGNGVTPEPGVGPVRHEVVLQNVYDVNTDPLGIIDQWRAERDARGADLNDMERAVLAAGFDGYFVSAIGAAVIIGPEHTNIPVRQVANEDAQGDRGQQAPQGSVPDGRGVRGSPGVLDESLRQDPLPDGPLAGLPTPVRVDGRDVAFGPLQAARDAAVRYAQQRGIDYRPARTYVEVDTARAKRIANAYDEMLHAPQDPRVKAAYAAMIEETVAQWQAIKETGLKVEFITGDDPYGNNPRLAIQDVVENNHLWVFPTDFGYGDEGDRTSVSAKLDPEDNPMLALVPGEEISGRPVRANDIFRVVHDYFGHIKEGVGFRARGEENAWQQHMAMYSPLARLALTTETRGQNSWVNFGPYAESNKTASGADTKYAPQKVGLLPDWAVTEGYAGGAEQFAAGERKQPRGTFSPKALTTTLIAGKANVSTFLHETAHYFLTVYADMAASPDATPRMVQDMQTLLDWFGVADLDTWNAMSLDEQRRYHEQFAYSYELYLFEGKAPTPELKSLFQRFGEWLRRAYTSIREQIGAIYKNEFDTELPGLTPEVRQVMDRMVASEEAVNAELTRRAAVPMFQTQEESGMDDAEWAAYQDDLKASRADAIDEITRASLRNVQWLSGAEGRVMKALQARHDELRAQVRREVIAEVQQNPRDQLRRWLRRGEIVQPDGTVGKEPEGTIHRLDRAKVEAMFPGRDLTALSGMLRNDGLDPDHVAESPVFGFATGRALVEALLEMRPFDEVVNARTDQRMLAEHAELVEGTPEFRNAVAAAVNNTARGKLLAAELKALRKSTKPVRLMQAAARRAAEELLGKTKVGDISVRSMQAAEDRIVLQIEAALRKNDTEAVIDLKRRQLMHSEMVSLAHEASIEIAAAKRSFVKMFRADTKLAKVRNVDMVLAARWILGLFGLTTKKQKETTKTALDVVRANAPTALAEFEPIMLESAQRAKDYTELTLQEFRDLRTLVDWMWARSKRDKEIKVGGQRVLREAAVDEMLTAMREVHGDAPIRGITDEETRKSLRWSNTFAKLKRVESWARQMDGGKPNGPVTRYLFRELRESYDRYLQDRERLLVKIRDALKSLDLKEGKIQANEDELRGAPVFNGTKELLGAVQHAGNSSNLRRLLLGYGWADPLPNEGFDRTGWDAFFARMQREGHITKAHLDYLQLVWDMNEFELKPLAQEVNHEVYGLFFAEVKGEPMQTEWGTYRGGYMPAKPDPDHPGNADLKQRAGLDAISEMEQGASAMLATGRGFTITRQSNVMRPLLLDIKLQVSHLDEVLRFIHMQPALRDAASILKDQRFAGYLNAVDGSAIKSMLMPWLEDVAQNLVTKPSSMPALDKFFGFLRRSTGLNFMFSSLRNAAQQITGVSNIAVYVKGRHIRAALAQYYTTPGTTEWVMTRSKAMRVRLENEAGQLHEDINVLLDPSWMGDLSRWTNKYGYWAQKFMQSQVDVVAWLAAYRQELERIGADETDANAVAMAVAEADTVVRLTQGSVTPADTAAYERSSAFARLFTQFSSYFNAVLNQIISAPPGAKAKTIATINALIIPALGAATIAAIASGGDEFDDKDGDGYSDEVIAWLFATQAKAALGMVPGFGPIAAQAFSGDARVADRLQPAPAWTMLQALARSVSNLTSGNPRFTGRQTADLFQLIAGATGIPVGGVGKSLGYMQDVAGGRVFPRDAFDYLRGAVSGRASVGTRP